MDSSTDKSNASSSKEEHSTAKPDNASVRVAYPDSLADAKDGNPPKCIYDAFEKYGPKSASEIMNLLVHLSMIDSGFNLCTGDGSLLLPTSWRDIATTLKYSKPSYQLSVCWPPKQVEFTCTIVIVTIGSTKQVLASFIGQDSEISVKFDTKHYVTEGTLQPENLKRLSHFDKLVRNHLLHPLRISAHAILGLPAPWHLLGLPYDIMLPILKLLPVADILNLRLTCTAMKNAVDDARLWFYLFKRDFSSELSSRDSVSSYVWSGRYKLTYLRKKEAKRQEESLICHHMDPYYGRPPGSIIYPREPNFNDPYGPTADLFPSGFQPNPYADPDSPYFGGDLLRIRGGGRNPLNPFPHGPRFGPGLPNPYTRPGSRFGRSGGPRMHFL